MKRASSTVFVITIWSGVFLAAAQGRIPDATTTPKFSRPQVVSDLNPRPTIAGRFDCSRNGTIYALVDGYIPNSGAAERMALLGIHPDGTATNFNWHSIRGYEHVFWPKSVFVGYGHVNVLVKAERDTAGGKKIPDFLVLTFDQDGVLARTTGVPDGIEPWVLGAFRSGNMILLSEDRLNHRMAVDLLAPDGSPIRQLDLGNDDYLALATSMPDGPGKYDQSFLIASSTFHPVGDNLLLIPTVSGLPILTFSEQGVVRAVVPKVSTDTVFGQFISSTPTTVKLRLGAIIPSQHPVVNSEGKQMGIMGITPSLQITEISLADGRILQQTNFGSTDVQPACEANGSLRLLTSSGSSGFLSVTTEPMP